MTAFPRPNAYELACTCGARLRGATGERLLEEVERHALEAHPEPGWRGGPTLADQRHQVVALGERVSQLERGARP